MRGGIAMLNPVAAKDNARQPAENTGRSARQTDIGLHQAPAIIVPQTGFCIYVARQR
jgi:hypothetical protein